MGTERERLYIFLACLCITCVQSTTADDDARGLDTCLYISECLSADCSDDSPGAGSIDCSNNKLNAIPSYNASYQNITDLNLSRNNIEDINDELKYYTKLTDLDISKNRIYSVVDHAFKNLENLMTLNMSHNKLKDLDSHMFDGLNSLVYLSLDNNDLGELENYTFQFLTSLQELSLQNNKLVNIDGAAFVGLQNLKSLDLSTNKLKTIPTSAMRLLPKVEELVFESNIITEIPLFSFSNMSLLRELNLKGNRISHIHHECAFCLFNSEPMLKFKVLLMNQNRLKNIPIVALKKLPNIEVLNFDENKMERLHFQSFANLSHLKRVSVSYMEFLKNIEFSAFYNLTNLQELRLQYNKELQTINKGAFSILPRLSRLFLDHNIDLQHIPRALINWSQLSVLNLEGSNLSCTCDFEWIMDLWAMNMSVEYLNPLTCSHPKKFIGFQVSHNPFRCKHSNKVQVTPKDNKILYAFVISTVSFLLLSSCFMTIKFRNKICLMCRRHFKYRRYKDESIFVVETEKVKHETEEVDAASEGTPMTTVSLSDDNDPIL